jgi:WD40 repeat protein
MVAGGEAANIKVYRASDGVVLATITTGIISSVDGMSLSPNGSILAAGDEGGKIHLYNASTHAWIRTIVHGADEQAGGPAGVHADINSLSWTSDSVYLATASRQGNVKVWRASDGTWVRTYTGHTGSVKATRISPNKAWLASAGFDNQVIFYNLATGAVLKKFALGWMGETVEWTPDSHNLFVGGQGTGIKVYRTLTSGFTEVQTIPCFRQEYIHFTTTMGNLLTAHEDGTVRKWALTKRY